MAHLIAPSLLSADFSKLGLECDMINRSEADWFHLDIMDGVFVPNLSFGIPVVKAIKQNAAKPLDVHLMIVEPGRYVETFAKAGADWLTVHYEACTHLHRVVHQMKSTGLKAGVSLNPHQPVAVLTDIIQDLDLVLLMSVNPGFGGQKFIDRTYARIGQTRELIERSGSKALIEIDGGVDFTNASLLIKAGADVLVAGNTVFSSPDPAEAIFKLKHPN